MERASSRDLGEHRYAPHTESRAMMREMRRVLSEIQQEFPEVKGFGFFGSRTIGRERDDGARVSDLDVVVYYDGSAYAPLGERVENPFVFDATTGELGLGSGSSSLSPRDFFLIQLRRAMYRLMQKHHIPTDEIAPAEAHLVEIDISSTATNEDVRHFMLEVSNETAEFRTTLRRPMYTATAWRIAMRFALAIGEGVQESRKNILDAFERTGIGEKYWKAVVYYLQMIERRGSAKRESATPYAHFPTSIADARAVFFENENNKCRAITRNRISCGANRWCG